MSAALFIADIHLSARRPPLTRRFLEFLQGPAREAGALYILGDLFDVWIGDDDRGAPIPEVLAGLRALADGGTRIRLQHGNRDFLLGAGFCQAAGCKLIPEVQRIELGGRPTLLMHGDQLCTDDRAYQEARNTLRQPEVMADFLAKPLGERAVLAAEYRRRSGEAASLLAEDIMDANADTVADYLRRYQCRRLIHGHTHRPAVHEFELDGEPAVRWVIPDWREHGAGFLQAHADGTLSTRAW